MKGLIVVEKRQLEVDPYFFAITGTIFEFF